MLIMFAYLKLKSMSDKKMFVDKWRDLKNMKNKGMISINIIFI